MKLILLPGMDGTGLLFKPFLDIFTQEVETEIISYPCDEKLSYLQLVSYVHDKLPKSGDYALLAESFSGPIAYEVSKIASKRLKKIIFVASFIESPNKILCVTKHIPFYFLIPKKLPKFILNFLLGKLSNSSLFDLMNNSLSKVSSEVLEFRIKEMAHLPKPTKPIGLKCIYIEAKNDRLVAEKKSITIENLAEDFTRYKIDGSHFILQVNPKACSKIIMKNLTL